MTEAEWLACTDPEPMLALLRDKASRRKWRLIAWTCAELVRSLLPTERWARLLDLAGRLADGAATNEERAQAVHAAGRATDRATAVVAYATYKDASPANAIGALANVKAVNPICDYYLAGAIRCIFGPLPFRPVSPGPSWLTSPVVALAEGISADRAYDRLPLLADALQEAGCENDDILAHCREPGAHVRGCWVVDLVLGKE
ncbi:MAG: hypothetical protein JWO38_4445 [Gemmataceae bacterium]|nr:hypothetical protein [Gemmataceae bacterium]